MATGTYEDAGQSGQPGLTSTSQRTVRGRRANRRLLVLALLPVLLAAVALVAVLRSPGDEPFRDPYAWPFARDSIWNTPIGSDAEYVPAGLGPELEADGAITVDPEHIALDPTAPLRTLRAPGEAGDGALVHVPDDLAHDGDYNGCATLLAEDGRSVWQGQPLELEPGEDPSWRYTIPSRPVDLHGPGIEGCHGGSRMSGVGGSLRVGELEPGEPIRHALKINVHCRDYCWQGEDQQGSSRWPALTADAYWDSDRYGGSNPALRMGALLALPPDTDLSDVTDPKARRIAEALQDYGGYVVDDTAWDVHALSADQRLLDSGEWPARDDEDFHGQLQEVFTQLHVVDNNAPDAVGGGGEPRRPLAPCLEAEPACD